MFFSEGRVAEDVASIDHRMIIDAREKWEEQLANEGQRNGNNYEEEIERYDNFKDYVYDFIETNHPNELSNFHNSMTSGDHMQIIDALESISDKYIEAMLNNPEYQEFTQLLIDNVDNIDGDLLLDENGTVNQEYLEAHYDEIMDDLISVMGEDPVRAINFVTVLLAAVAVVVVAVAGAALAIGIVVVLILWFWTGVADKGPLQINDSEMQTEVLIDDIAQTLAST